MIRPIAAAALLLASATAAQVPPTATAVPAAPSATAMRLADRLASDAIVLEQTRRTLRTQLPEALQASADMQSIETAWPGITGEFVAAMEPIILGALSRHMPAYRRDVATLFQRHMTADELLATDAFYASPPGQRLLALTLEGVDLTAMMRKQIESGGKAQVSGSDLRTAIVPAVQPAVSRLATEDQMRLMEFGMSPAGRKLSRLNPELLELSARFSDLKDPATDAEIEKAVAALIERRAAGKRRK